MRERKQVTVERQGKRRITADFSLETLEAQRKWNNTRTEKQEQRVCPMIPSQWKCLMKMKTNNKAGVKAVDNWNCGTLPVRLKWYRYCGK